jgi:hypothetical protein
MSTSESFDALHRANPRYSADHTASVESVQAALRTELVAAHEDNRPRRRLIGVSAVTAAAAVAGVAAFLTIGSPGGGPGVENARAAVTRAAKLSAVSAERSGTAVVRMRANGAPWAETAIRWHGEDVSVTKDGRPMLVVAGTLYAIDPGFGGWVDFGSPSNIDPDSGTTPAEHLAAVREDVGGTTLRRITRDMSGLTTSRLAGGSTVYSGTVPAGMIARDTGFKEGQSIRVLPFGYVAHDAAANPQNLLDVAITVGADGIVRRVAVTWPGWTYTVDYGQLGEAPALVAPANAKSITSLRRP